ncbi:MAG: ROK family protein [Schwartzia sp.]|nr:ROK family protein [Schwartzia sp. (in: firmicutes)]
MAFYGVADIGGTMIKLGVADEKGTILARGEVKNPVREAGVGAMIESVASAVHDFRKSYALEGLAVSTAGVVDEEGVVVHSGPAFPGYEGTTLAARLGKLTGLPCAAMNDANCAALGEAWIGAGRRLSPLACVTLGTGVGGAVLMDGQPCVGASGFAGEIGYLPFEDDILENAASVSALVRFVTDAKKMPVEAIDGARVLEMARAGDDAAREGVMRQMHALAAGLAALICVVDPAIIVIGGGVAAGADVLAPALSEEMDRLPLADPMKKTRIRFSTLGNDAGMVGALSYFLQKFIR